MEFSFILDFILLDQLQDNAFLLSLPFTQILLQVTTESYSQLITVQLTSTKQYTRNTLRVRLTLTTSNKLNGPKVWNVRLARFDLATYWERACCCLMPPWPNPSGLPWNLILGFHVFYGWNKSFTSNTFVTQANPASERLTIR